jgi:DNA-binding MarR family transcriptional regulator
MSAETPAPLAGAIPPDAGLLPTEDMREIPSEDICEGNGYWYTKTPDSFTSVELLNLLRAYREAEKAMRARTRELMGMGETDLVALRFLLRQRAADRVCRQRDLAQALSMSPASASALVDRLSRDGYIRRVPHPEDRRSVGLEILETTDREVKATLNGMHTRMLRETESLTEEERAGAAKFLTGLIRSVCSDADQ